MSTTINKFAVSLFGTDADLSLRKSKTGKDIGTRATFGDMPASEARAIYKAEGLKGNALKKAVNDILSGKKDIAWAKAEVTVSALRSKGFVPDYADVNAKGTGATMRFVRPVEIEVEKVVEKVAPTAETFKAWFTSLSAEEKAAMLK